ncbi:MAG: hypothetical protein ACRDV3_13810, partial [Acidothermaceae bacterium]
VKTRQSDDEPTQDEDGVSGELPLKSVQRDVSPPEWNLPEQTRNDDLQYSTDYPASLAADTLDAESGPGRAESRIQHDLVELGETETV